MWSLPKYLLPFTVLYLFTAALFALITKNSEFIFYIVFMLILIAALSYVHYKITLTKYMLWGFSIWGFLHMAGGLVPVPSSWPFHGEQSVLYSLWLIPNYLKYDQIVHFFGFAITTWLCWHGIARKIEMDYIAPAPDPSPGLLTLAAAGGMGFGALNELVEFIATLAMPNTNVGGYYNTGWDLVANLLGCLTAVIVIRMRWSFAQ